MDFDLVIINALLVTDTEIRECDIAIKDEKIALIEGKGTLAKSSTKKIIDADGAFVTPGGIDAHIHLDEPKLFGEAVTADNFETGNKTFTPRVII
jgi:dihydropyrimidinase